jgi:hypothetical protein
MTTRMGGGGGMRFRKTRVLFKHGVLGVSSGSKDMTRRNVNRWGERYTNCILKNIVAGSWMRAQTNYGTATQFGWIKITNMYLEEFGDMPLIDVGREGFPGYSLSQFKGLDCFKGCSDSTLMWVVVFVFHPLF